MKLYPDLGYPRKSQAEPDCLLFMLPNSVTVTQVRFLGSLPRKITGLLLRTGVAPRRIEKLAIAKKLIELVGRLFLQLALSRRLSIFASTDVGYAGEIYNQDFLIGYFQSWRYNASETVRERMMSISPKDDRKEFRDLMIEAQQVSPIVVHIRLGDYLEEPHFGIPSVEYYLDALGYLRHLDARPVWIFTNDVNSLKLKYNDLLSERTVIVNDDTLNPAQVMQVMRHGSAYVIGNSSFSWWAANLRFDRSATVFAPKPWFRYMPEPMDLIPPGWRQMDSKWVQ